MTPTPRSGSHGRGGSSGAPKKPRSQGAGAKGAGAKGSGKSPKTPAPKSRAFGRERFGQSLGPVKQNPPARTQAERDVHDPDGIRLQKLMAQAGVASRRVCEEMILEGRVEVDGQIVTELGLRVDPKSSTVAVDGISLQLKENMIYLVFNKPKGVVSTMDDPEGRKNISDFLKNKYAHERLFHVGRLDQATEGLLLLTNDGELANRLTHPKYEVPKTYLVQTKGPMESGISNQLKRGIELEDGVTKVDAFKLVDSTPGHVLVEVVLHSGKNRIVRRLFDAVGYPVERLVRLQVGPIRLGDQKQGTIRVLGNQEVGHLLASVGL
ncbi:pseudouridine synthase [Psychromicrobium sp. YIM B11713]|uniref:pseudouridine synthase n=1 Tax=Psychromicrobium sp. YIM B11713 TaxID=3145233 RepID=UPI00374F1DA3